MAIRHRQPSAREDRGSAVSYVVDEGVDERMDLLWQRAFVPKGYLPASLAAFSIHCSRFS